MRSPHDSDNLKPTQADIIQFASRRLEQREATSRRPSNADDAWEWFLSFFAGQDSEADSSAQRKRRAA